MKKLTAIFSDDAKVDITALVEQAIEIKLETIHESKKPKRIVKRGQTIPQLIASHFTFGGQFNMTLAEKWVTAQGYAKESAAPAISHLVAKGCVKRGERGTLLWISKTAPLAPALQEAKNG